ncbi:MAG: pyridoxal-phosphate dependent enzyme, partial [Gemmatimonadales bacterium]
MAGGSLVTKLVKGFEELARLGWVDGMLPRVFGGQAAGCAPIATAVEAGSDRVTPVTPRTVARSIAIGNPVDGDWAAKAIRQSGGWAAVVPESEVVEGIQFLAKHSGIFAETAGGVTVSAARRLASEGRLTSDDEVVLVITGNGFKTVEALDGALAAAPVIEPHVAQLEAHVR